MWDWRRPFLLISQMRWNLAQFYFLSFFLSLTPPFSSPSVRSSELHLNVFGIDLIWSRINGFQLDMRELFPHWVPLSFPFKLTQLLLFSCSSSFFLPFPFSFLVENDLPWPEIHYLPHEQKHPEYFRHLKLNTMVRQNEFNWFRACDKSFVIRYYISRNSAWLLSLSHISPVYYMD